jgi:hypothetical protein
MFTTSYKQVEGKGQFIALTWKGRGGRWKEKLMEWGAFEVDLARRTAFGR